jgi:hypothetical protein
MAGSNVLRTWFDIASQIFHGSFTSRDQRFEAIQITGLLLGLH